MMDARRRDTQRERELLSVSLCCVLMGFSESDVERKKMVVVVGLPCRHFLFIIIMLCLTHTPTKRERDNDRWSGVGFFLNYSYTQLNGGSQIKSKGFVDRITQSAPRGRQRREHTPKHTQ